MKKVHLQCLKRVDKGFWYIIKLINWPEHLDYKIARDRLHTLLPQTRRRKEFQKDFSRLIAIINEETHTRNKEGRRSFAPGISHGADDCHYMDLPGHLIGMGETAVRGYLNGELVNYSAVECLTYMFQDDTDFVILHENCKPCKPETETETDPEPEAAKESNGIKVKMYLLEWVHCRRTYSAQPHNTSIILQSSEFGWIEYIIDIDEYAPAIYKSKKELLYSFPMGKKDFEKYGNLTYLGEL